ncbi:hypothetical protein PMAYCL1PPCAC_32458, partial [Pristionchus mayeri]
LFNVFVCSLIVLDNDSRGKTYRKYLFSLQFFSTIADIGLSAYIPFFQVNCRVIYADSFFANYFGMLLAMMAYFVCI